MERLGEITFGPEFAQKMPLHPIFLEGAEAHKAGHHHSENPYTGYDAVEWLDGWQEAEYAAEYWNNG